MEMKVKITFHGMPHSDPMEQHAREKLSKLLDFLPDRAEMHPLYTEMWLKANKQHPHHAVELHFKSPVHDLHAHDEGPDMYICIDTTIDKMVTLIKKHKERSIDDRHKPDTEKRRFNR